MKFIKETAPKGLHIPAAALRLSGIACGDRVEMRVLDNGLFLLKGQMTAPELLSVVAKLHSTAAELFAHLTTLCGPCEDCGEESCPCGCTEEETIDLPEYLRQEAGIPKDAKLCAEVDQEAGSVVIVEAGHRYDLRDVPSELLDIFVEAGICLGELEEHMILEDTVYGV